MNFSNFLKTFDELSYKKIVSIATFMAVLFAIPVGVYLVRQQTRLDSRAAYVKPEKVIAPKATPGPTPKSPPQIGRVFPWVGKVGDIVWIQGKNFGTNPIDKKITIGGIVLQENQIDAWEDDLIQAYIPDGAAVNGIVEVKVGSHLPSRSLPYILYSSTTNVKLCKEGSILSIENGREVGSAIIWTGDDEIPTQKHTITIDADIYGRVEFFDTQNLPLLSIILLNKEGQVVPYYVDPIEFDF